MRKTSSAERGDRALRLVLRGTRRLLADVAARSGDTYAAPDLHLPISEHWLDVIARRFGARLVEGAVPEGMQEVAIPGYCCAPRIVVRRGLAYGPRQLALRHGLAHLVAGELDVEEGGAVRFMSSIHDWTTHEERQADLFALADLIPDRAIDAALLEGLRLSQLPGWVARDLRPFAPMWPRARLEDRVRLRVALYEERRD